MTLRSLIIDDDPQVRENLFEVLNGSQINGYILSVQTDDFQQGLNALSNQTFDLVILDLCAGEPHENSEKTGVEVLTKIKATAFIPVIFFTGLPQWVEDLQSDIIKVVGKGRGIDALKNEIAIVINGGFIALKNKVLEATNEAIRSFFWDFVHPKKEIIDKIRDNTSLGYLLLRRFAQSLSKEQIKRLLEDDKIQGELAHPMEFYIYPVADGEFEFGEIIEKDGQFYCILTPSCDFVFRQDKRKAENVLLAKLSVLTTFPECEKFISGRQKGANEKGSKDLLIKLISNNKSDRYYFLPGTPFLEHSVIDFQKKQMTSYNDLANFTRVAKLDDPFAQSMLASFIRHYNRIGFPDIDVEFILSDISSRISTHSEAPLPDSPAPLSTTENSL